jgi:two-component system phosphate regulon sensor histidine kinase PhoR
VSTKLSWASECRAIVSLIVLGAFLGWLLGHTLIAVTICLLVVLIYSLLQLHRMHNWLSGPEAAPPEGVGLWGEVFDKTYALQRRNHEAHGRLQSTVDYLHDSFASMRDGVVIVNSAGAIQWSNASAEILLGLRFPADRGQAILNLVRAPEFHHYFLEEDYLSPLQLEANTKSSRFLRIEITSFGEGDRLIFIRDVSKLIRLEQMRKDFVGNVSHELRTPLTVISGYLGTMLDSVAVLDSRFHKPLQQMDQQAQRMESLLRDLLWLSRLESVEHVDKSEMVDIARLLDELKSSLQVSYPDRDIQLCIETDYKIAGDHRQLYSAVSNLVINALKYSEPPSPVVISWSQQDKEYHLCVIDQGEGIAATHIPRLTERFYRVDDSRSSATGGTGLGLAIVKHVAAGHGGELRVESVVGLGSKFILVFSP